MKTFYIICLVILTAMLADANAATAKKKIAWAKDYTVAQAQAKKANKPIMIDFYTDWCTWCKKLDTDTYSNKTVVTYVTKSFVAVKVNAEKEGKGLSAKYGITGFPTIMIVDASGTPIGKIIGYVTPVDFIKQAKQVIAGKGELAALLIKYEKDPANADLCYKVIARYATLGESDKVLAIVDKAEKAGMKDDGIYVVKIYNAAGDVLRAKSDFANAVPYYNKAVLGAKDTGDLAYARFSIGACLALQNKYQEALTELQEVLKIKGCPDNIKTATEQGITWLEEKIKTPPATPPAPPTVSN